MDKTNTTLAMRFLVGMLASALLGMAMIYMLIKVLPQLGPSEYEDKAPGFIAGSVGFFAASIFCLVAVIWLMRKPSEPEDTPEPQPEKIPMYIENLQDGDWYARFRSAKALGEFGPAAKDAIPALTELTKDRIKDVSAAAQEALTKIKNQPE